MGWTQINGEHCNVTHLIKHVHAKNRSVGCLHVYISCPAICFTEDPNETNNLAYEPFYADKVIELKNMILAEIQRHNLISFEEGLELPSDQFVIPIPQNDAGLLRTDFCEGADLTV